MSALDRQNELKIDMLREINYAKSEALISMYFDNKFGEQFDDTDFAQVLKYM